MGAGVQPVFVWIALGSNQGDRIKNMQDARFFLNSISESALICSSLFETSPIGPADKPFYNAVIRLQTYETPETLLRVLKEYERAYGRDMMAPRWSNRIIDLDIIAMEKVQIQLDWLQIPHKEYKMRQFVLVPLHEIEPDWLDPVSHEHITEMLLKAPPGFIKKLPLSWT
jgi:2-amino-4-hydroxy-6-hydroxymethyldihydropteridine diphosphokinase